jgi:hypothetical protein
VDKLPNLARAFNAQGIPLVVFIKNKQAFDGLVGLQPKDSYVQKIVAYADHPKPQRIAKLSGEIKDGVRVVRFVNSALPEKVVVKKGEVVKFIIEKAGKQCSLNLNGINVTERGTYGDDLHVTFKAETAGTYLYSFDGNSSLADAKKRSIVVQ